MSTAQKILMAEVVVLLLPISILAVALCGITLQAAALSPLEELSVYMGLFSLLSLLGLASGWRLVLAFLIGGPQRLAGVASWHIVLASVAALIAIVGVITRLAGISGPFAPFALGAPALVPFIHLAVVRHASS
jgi:hypothetical protein